MSDLSDVIERVVNGLYDDSEAIEAVAQIVQAPVVLPLLAANGCDPRLISYFLSTAATKLPQTRWLVAIWAFDQAELSGDPATSLNLLGWLSEEFSRDTRLIPAAVRRRASDFLVTASAGPDVIRMSLLDVLVTGEEQAIDLLSAPAARALRERLVQLEQADDDLTRIEATELRAALDRRDFVQSHPTDVSEVRRLVADLLAHKGHPPLDKRIAAALDVWTDKLIGVERALTLVDASTRVLELAVAASDVSLGKYGQLMLQAQSLVDAVAARRAPKSPAPHLNLFDGDGGSFVIRVKVAGRIGIRLLDEVESLLAALGDEGRLTEIIGKNEAIAKSLRRFLEIGLQQSGPVRATFLHHRSASSVSHYSFEEKRTRQTIAWLEGEERHITSHKWRGHLELADSESGRFRLRRAGKAITGEAIDPKVLNGATLNEEYVFLVDEKAEVSFWGMRTKYKLRDLQQAAPGETNEAIKHLPKASVPQVSLRKVEEIVGIIADKGRPPEPAEMHVRSQRNIDYNLAAARILGLVNKRGRLTTTGRIWNSMRAEEKWRTAATHFEASAVAQSWCAWAGVERIADVNPESAAEFLAEHSDLGPGTIKERAPCLKNWLKTLSQHLGRSS